MKHLIVKSLGDLIDIATPNEPDPVSGRLRDNSVYRGMACKDWRLITSLDRLGGTNPPHTKTHLEEHILRNFLRHARPFISNSSNLWELMVVAEHHGVPTRLLDWTHSPLIAAHFATRGPCPKEEEDR
ncbi:MAG: FRG domain-containing protein, partial [Verrucomicrobiales bacterium]